MKKRWKILLGVVLAIFVAGVFIPPASGHPSPNPIVEQYFAKRCEPFSIEGVLNCEHRAGVHWGVRYSLLKQISWHESKWNPRAKNPKSSARGLFQFLTKTWYPRYHPCGWNPYQRHSRYSPKYASLAAAFAIHCGFLSWWRGAY